MSVVAQLDLTRGSLDVEVDSRGGGDIVFMIRDGSEDRPEGQTGYVALWLTPLQALELQSILAEAVSKSFEIQET